jgi:flagellar hook-associated protein 2
MTSIGMFSGLASGIDFRTLVDEIMRIESRPLNELEAKLGRIDARSSAFAKFSGLVETFESAAEELRLGSAFERRSASVVHDGVAPPLSASASDGAAPGSYDVRVLQLATREKVAGGDFASRGEALGLEGSFRINGRTVSVAADDALVDIAGRINEAFLGVSEGRVSASTLSAATDRHRLVLSARDTGADGVDLVDPDGVLRDLGLLDELATTLKNATSDGFTSDAFSDAGRPLGELMGLASPPAPAALTLGPAGQSFQVTVDLATDSLMDVASAINTAASGAGSAVTAQVVSSADADGNETHRLDVSGTTEASDANRILETLGVLKAGRSEVTQRLASDVTLQNDTDFSAATTGTQVTALALGDADAGVQAGDTVTFSGTLGDGTAFSYLYDVGAGDTVGTLLAELNAAIDAQQTGGRGATASLVDGQIVLTDDAAGASRLALSAVAGNEGGGALDLGGFAIAETGRQRLVSAGSDAAFEVDGVYLTSDSNTVTDVLGGVNMTLTSADPSVTARLEIGEDLSGVSKAMQKLVDGYNALNDFMKEQAADDNAPLSGDVSLRAMVRTIQQAMQETLGGDTTGGLTRLGEIGITIQRDGSFELDTAVLDAALQADPTAMRRLLGVHGSGSISSLDFVSSTDATTTGNYAVDITQLAARARVAGAGFGGTYVDDGTPDTMTIRDIGGGGTYEVALADGMTAADIVDAINAEFATEQARVLTSETRFHSDDAGTVAEATTTLDSLFDTSSGSPVSMAVADGDILTISGRNPDGTSFSTDFTVGDATTQTLGDLMASIQAAMGTDVEVALDGSGNLTVTNVETGSSLTELTVASDNEDVDAFTLGVVEATTAGRDAAELLATLDESGQVQITSEGYGSKIGFEIGYTAGGSDGTGALGIAAETYSGVDVAGTIGGAAAEGTGRLLSGSEGTPAEGLALEYTGEVEGVVGEMTFTRGIASMIELVAERYLGSEGGSIQSLIDANEDRISSVERRIDTLEGRLERREAALLERFIAMEQAIARSQNTTTALLNSIGAGVNYGATSQDG